MAQKYDEEQDSFTGVYAEAEELRFLRYFYRMADNAMGPASDDIYQIIQKDFTAKTGVEVPPAYHPPVE